MLYKRPGYPFWWVRFRIRGREIRRSTRTADRARAEKIEKRLRDAAWDQTELGEVAYTWNDATKRWLTEKAAKRSLLRDKDAFALVAEFFDGLPLTEITKERLAKVRQILEVGRKPGTVLRLLSPIRSVLRAATLDWGWLKTVPVMKVPKPEKNQARYISGEQFETLWKELPPHQQALSRFSLETGQRFGAVAKLKWSEVDLERRHAYVRTSTSKSKKPIPIPLNESALAVLHDQVGKHEIYVFTDHRGRAPIGSIKTAWGKARKRAGLDGLKWHELRHTWASWHTINGTPPIALKELGGWASLAMVERYSHLSSRHLTQWVETGTNKGGAMTKTGSVKRRLKSKPPVL
jgi:integrase